MNRITDTVKHLIIINVIMFIGTVTIGGGELFRELFALHFPVSDSFKPWQIVTHMFMHGSITHLLFNMFGLWMFGTPVEQVLGRKKFLFIYFSAGLGAVLFQLGYHYYDYYSLISNISDLGLSQDMIHQVLNFNILDFNEEGQQVFNGRLLSSQLTPLLIENNISPSLLNGVNTSALFELNMLTNITMVGASGCLMGILAAFGMMNPNAELMLMFLPIPIKAKYFIPGLILMDLILGFSGQSIFGFGNIAHFAHVGGAVTGFIIMWYWKKNQFNKNRWD